MRSNVLDIATESIRALSKKKGTLLIAIDGCGGAGKTTVASTISRQLEAVCIVHMDDFYRPSLNRNEDDKAIGANFDWERLRDQVLEPASQKLAINYQIYDWQKDSIEKWEAIGDYKIIIVEGVYSSRKEIRHYHDYIIWVDASYETRLKRGIERDGLQARDIWMNVWMPEEDRYMTHQNPRSYANLVVDTDIHIKHSR